MKSKRRIETTIETHEIMVVRRRAYQSLLWCTECAAEAAMFTPEEAARLASVNPRAIYRRIEAGGLHFTETADGQLLVCQASLLASKAAAS